MNTMARKIQAFWRYRFRPNTTRRILSKQLNGGISIEAAKTMSFEALVECLKERPILSRYKAVLLRFLRLYIIRPGSPSSDPVNVNVRAVLAGFMIEYTPSHVF